MARMKLSKKDGSFIAKEIITPFDKLFFKSLEKYSCFDLNIGKRRFVISRIK